MKRIFLAGAVILAGWSVAAWSGSSQPQIMTPRAQMGMPGYLPKGSLPDSLLLNPPPPAPGSAAEARDIEAAKAAVALRGTPRFALARSDADLFSSEATGTFSCAAGVAISSASTPRLDALLRRAARDLAPSTNPTKDKYKRQRPFMINGEPTCTPEAEPTLRGNGSYPSGHSAIGYGWGLILAEVLPDRAGPLVARGRAFGDSRRVCNVHWLSDVEEGRVVATAVFARLNADKGFQADLKAARAELAKRRGAALPASCEAEASALSLR